MSECRSCKQEIKWVKLESGKLNPVDLEFYNIQDDLVDPDMIVVNPVTGKSGKLRNIEKGYISHFSTCPQAKEWRSKKVK